MIFLLNLIVEEQLDVEKLCAEIPKIEAIYQGIKRKGLVTEEGKLTLSGKELMTFLETEEEHVELTKKKSTEDDFTSWWKVYPGTDTFKYKSKGFTGTRSLRAKRDDCKVKFDKIIEEGEYTVTDLIDAIKYEVLQKYHLPSLPALLKLCLFALPQTYSDFGQQSPLFRRKHCFDIQKRLDHQGNSNAFSFPIIQFSPFQVLFLPILIEPNLSMKLPRLASSQIDLPNVG
jgi:hypothetical protein